MVQSLYTITFLIPATRLEEALIHLPHTARLAIKIDTMTHLDSSIIYRVLFFNQVKPQFCIAMPANVLLNAPLQDAMLSLFNHPQYSSNGKKPDVILIYNHEDEISGEATTLFQAKAQAQGWAGLHYINFFKSPYHTQQDTVFSLSVSSVAEVAASFKEVSQIAGAHFIIEVDDIGSVPEIQKAFLEMEQQLAATHPKMYAAYMQLLQTTTELEETKEQLQLSHKQLDSLKQYNAILKSEEQTRRILEFYHSEYEVLPLWYKRFGHILKVITGKRSLKSLFDDEAKKGTT